METGQKITQISSNIDNISNNELSIQVSLNGLSFCILNNIEDTIIYFNELVFDKRLTPHYLLDKLKHSFNSIKELNQNFCKINVIHENELSTIVPKTLFKEESIADYLKFNSRILQSDYITYDNILSNESVNVYVPYVNINNFLYDSFGTFEYNHFSTILIESLLSTEKNSNGLKMFVHVAKTHFEIIVIDSGKLLLYNTFEYQTKEDFIYYILFASEQLKLNPESFNLHFLGNIKKDDHLYTIVYKYIRNVHVENKVTNFKITKNMENITSNFVILNSF